MSPRGSAVVRCAVLACALGAGGCGAVDGARARVEALLGDEAEPAKGSEVVPEAPAEPVVLAAAGSGGAVGSSGEPDPSGEASEGSSGGPTPGDDTGTTGLLPMSYARPPDAPAVPGPDLGAARDPFARPTPASGAEPADPTAGTPEVTPPTIPETPATPVTPTTPTATATCLEGEWDVTDLHTLLRREIVEQARGRTVRFRGESGRYRLRFESGVLHGKAVHRRVSFDARLADVLIRYGVDVHGSFEAPARVEGTDVLVVDRPTLDTLKVRESVRFSTGKAPESRTLTLPIEGRWQLVCGSGSLALRPLEDGKPGPAITLSRPKP